MSSALLSISSKEGFAKIESLCGMRLADNGPMKTRGFAVANTDNGRFEGDGWRYLSCEGEDGALRIFQHETEPFLRETWIQRYVGAAGF